MKRRLIRWWHLAFGCPPEVVEEREVQVGTSSRVALWHCHRCEHKSWTWLEWCIYDLVATEEE